MTDEHGADRIQMRAHWRDLKLMTHIAVGRAEQSRVANNACVNAVCFITRVRSCSKEEEKMQQADDVAL